MLRAADSQIVRDFSGLQKATSLLTSLVRNPSFLEAYILPLLEPAKFAEYWYIAQRTPHSGCGRCWVRTSLEPGQDIVPNIAELCRRTLVPLYSA
jgi:hypothetical protein